MTNSRHRNISFATIAGLTDLFSSGIPITVRGSRVHELRNRLTILERPRERCLFLPYRGNDVVACLAEAFWVLAGRDDIAWITPYLPRAPEFSDDGITWRGAYGPRLRNWIGVDQLAESCRLLTDDISTRRAVMSLYDPGRDFVQSKDIPCNNWLHWMVRDGQLNLTIAVRSHDVVWGFSGVNSFEWSVLQEMMAYWVGAEIGDATYLSSSFHLYDHHQKRAQKMVHAFEGVNCYDFGLIAPAFRTSFDHLGQALQLWFALEAKVRDNPDCEIEAERRLADPLLAVSVEIIRIHHGVRRGWSLERLSEELGRLPSCDLAAAAFELYYRRYPKLIESISQPRIREFMLAYVGLSGATKSAIQERGIADVIKRLHVQKNAAYGTAWKKRGELTSVLANIARKVDRLEHHVSTGTELSDESLLDTAVDLIVYLLKYRLFLLERAPAEVAASEFPQELHSTLSDNLTAFDALVDRSAAVCVWGARSEKTITYEIVAGFEQLHRLATEGASSVMDRLAATSKEATLAFELVYVLDDHRAKPSGKGANDGQGNYAV